MTLNQLRYLVAIADAGLNITLAAERVHATQPGLSKQLKQLEDELGFALFTRKGKSLSNITPAGEDVLVRARAILEEASNIRALAANLRNEAEGALRIGTVHTQARFVLPKVLAELRRRFPQVSMHLDPGSQEEIVERLRAGAVDVAILSSSGAAPSGVFALPAYQWDRVVVVPKDHALAKLARAPTLADIAAYPLISYESSLKPGSSFPRAFAAQGLTPNLACTARDADLIKTYVRAGMGVGILAAMAMESADRADLAVLPAVGLFERCTTWIAVRREAVLKRYLQEFIVLFAPHLDSARVRAALADERSAASITPPLWGEGAQCAA
jgi:LysR family transcriptional regulator, cys regulon transcriptional activator